MRQPGRQRAQPGEAEAQQIAALGAGQGVQLVDDHAAEAGEDLVRIGIGEQQGQGFRRGQQHLRRGLALALALGGRRVAGPRLHRDGKAHLGHRLGQVAVDVDGERLQRRDIERVQPRLAGDPASSTRLGRNPASVLPPPVGATSRAERPARSRASSSS